MRRGKIFGSRHADNHDVFNASYRHVVLSAAGQYNRYRAQCDNDNFVSVRGVIES